MHRILWEVPIPGLRLPVHAYGFFLVLGFFLALHVAVRRGARVGLSSADVHDLSLVALLGGLAGARLFHVLENASTYDFGFLHAGRDVPAASVVAGVVLGVLALGAALGSPGRGAAIVFAAVAFLGARIAGVVRSDPQAILALAVLAVVLGGAVAKGRSRLAGVDWRRLRTWLAILLAAVAGAWFTTRSLYPQRWDWRAVAMWEGGLTFFGGFLLAVSGVLALAAWRSLPILATADALAPSVALALAFTRHGCFFNGCCWGKPCPSWFPGVRFPPGSFPADSALLAGPDGWSVPLYPAQVFESLLAFSLFLLLSWWFPRRRRTGEVFLLLGGLYSIGRFALEFLRQDTWDTRPLAAFPLTISQCVSAGVLAASLAGYALLRRRPVERIHSSRATCNSPN